MIEIPMNQHSESRPGFNHCTGTHFRGLSLLEEGKKKKYLLWELIPVPFQKKSETQGTSNQSEYNKASSLELGIFLLLSIDHRFIHPLMHYSCSQSDSPECFLDAK